MTIEATEEEYIKSRLKIVQGEKSSASTITADNGKTNEQKSIV